MPAAYRDRKSTLNNVVQSFKSVTEVLSPVHELTEEEMTHFDRIIISREAQSWTPHDLTIATNLAKTLCRFDELQDQLDNDGLTLERGGKLVAHPLLNASMTMSSAVQALSRTLGLSASQRGLSGASQAGRNRADATAREVIERAAAEDGLL